MSYPVSILPSEHHISPFPLNKLKLEEHSVSRRIEGKLEDMVVSVGGRPRLDPDCMGVIVGMSVNLLGGTFEPEYSSLRQIDKGKEPWDGKSNIRMEDFIDCYVDTGYDYVCYRVDTLHTADYPSKYKFANKDRYNAYQQFMETKVYQQFDPERELDISVTLTLEHAPTNLNYWHFVTKTAMTDNGKELKRDGSWRDMIFKHLLLTVLCREFSVEQQTTGLIPRELYLR